MEEKFNMLIDFNEIKEMTVPGINGGTGEMTARMYMSDAGKIIPCRIHAGGSIGMHRHETSDDIITSFPEAGRPYAMEKRRS